MNTDKLKDLQIQPQQRQRTQKTFWSIVVTVIVVALAALFFARPWAKDSRATAKAEAIDKSVSTNSPAATAPAIPASTADSDAHLLTVNGYIINRERIEISPRFLGVVTWIGVKKGDVVTNGQVVVTLDDTEYRARLQEAAGQLAAAEATVARDELSYERIRNLSRTDIESKEAADNARLALAADRATLLAAQGSRDLAQTYVNWCTIRAPINGVVLEKLVNPGELVLPQSFGGAGGPSTALLAVADPKDLQVEIDVNEADLSKITPGQTCRVSPEAYPEKSYAGYVTEIAPEADRAKGTLQIKVQILNPDKFLTPQLSARVDFLKAGK
jgi:HlyD family secretion protein